MTKQRSDGEGSIQKRHDNGCPRPTDARGKPTCKCKWRGVLVIGYTTSKTGKPTAKRKYVTANTQSGAASKLRQLREDRQAHTLPTRGSATVEQWLNHWHAVELPRTKPHPSTLHTYRKAIDSYLIPLLGPIRLDRLTADDILAAYDVLADTGNPTIDEPRPLAPATIHHAHTILARALRVAVQRKKVTANVAGPDYMDAPPRVEQEIVPLTTEEWRKVLEAAEGAPNAARWTVALALGLRQGEALGLRWSDVEGDVLVVQRSLARLKGRGLVFGPTKTKKARHIPLPSKLAAALKAHRKTQAEGQLRAGDQWQGTDLIFPTATGTATDPRTDYGRWVALLEKAGVRHYRLHDARHAAATMLMIEGVDLKMVMQILGHADVKTTMRYQHAAEEAMADARTKMDNALG